MGYFSDHNFSYNGKVVTEMTRDELILAVIDLGQQCQGQRDTGRAGTPDGRPGIPRAD